jgi:uncharacterized OsmC-like protein
MSQDPIISVTPKLEQVKNRFETWRQAKQKGDPIPKKLWQAAVALCDKFTVSQVAQALRLDYNHLKRRVLSDRQNQGTDTGTLADPVFFEWSVNAAQVDVRWEIEMQTPNGAKMKVTRSGPGAFDFGDIFNAFWRVSQ